MPNAPGVRRTGFERPATWSTTASYGSRGVLDGTRSSHTSTRVPVVGHSVTSLIEPLLPRTLGSEPESHPDVVAEEPVPAISTRPVVGKDESGDLGRG